MSEPLPLVTIVIAARPGLADIKAVTAARQLDYPADRLEILVTRGRQPSAQRNLAVRQAKGEWIYFLDDDSVPPPGNLRHALPLMAEPKVSMIGGPNLCPPNSPLIERAFAATMGTWLAFGPSRARYVAVGQRRDSGEKELILCNLLARRSAFLECGGFDEALYPNEENALMDDLVAKGGRLVYDPDFFVHRRPRPDLRAFLRMLFTYGRGRAEQFRLHPTPGSAVNFVPPLFCLYLLALLALPWLPDWTAAPLGLYFVAVILQTLAVSGVCLGVRLRVLPLVILSHVLYGAGFWRGLCGPLRSARRPEDRQFPITIETIASA